MALFAEYLKESGVDQKHIIEILDEYLRKVFFRDILLHGKIRDEGNFYKVTKFVFDNIGNNLSVNAISNTMRSQGHRISVDTVEN